MVFPGGIQSMSGRYASYWNAFLFVISLKALTTVSPALLQKGATSKALLMLMSTRHSFSYIAPF